MRWDCSVCASSLSQLETVSQTAPNGFQPPASGSIGTLVTLRVYHSALRIPREQKKNQFLSLPEFNLFHCLTFQNSRDIESGDFGEWFYEEFGHLTGGGDCGVHVFGQLRHRQYHHPRGRIGLRGVRYGRWVPHLKAIHMQSVKQGKKCSIMDLEGWFTHACWIRLPSTSFTASNWRLLEWAWEPTQFMKSHSWGSLLLFELPLGVLQELPCKIYSVRVDRLCSVREVTFTVLRLLFCLFYCRSHGS